jgi:hypothetical protein
MLWAISHHAVNLVSNSYIPVMKEDPEYEITVNRIPTTSYKVIDPYVSWWHAPCNRYLRNEPSAIRLKKTFWRNDNEKNNHDHHPRDHHPVRSNLCKRRHLDNGPYYQFSRHSRYRPQQFRGWYPHHRPSEPAVHRRERHRRD